MTRCYAYTRVSTVRQGERGVSLQEQHAAIATYAERHGIEIVEWFEERLTAAKRGRPLFARMLAKLRRGEAHGVVIHKIDRSARNLRDWTELGELIDAGVSVHFANESLDLFSRGGRLSADIQAVVAADYVRNLREEARKGIYGRLKQGVFPFGAPLGYLDTGAGRAKTVDPVRGPLIRNAFELYATGRYSLDSLLIELHRRGLRNRNGRLISRSSLSNILNNPFYVGLMRIRKTGETFTGKHTPVVRMSTFKQVEARLHGRVPTARRTHDFILRGLFRCSLCGRLLIGELQKGHVYYRCHTTGCPTRSFREEVLEAALLRSWAPVALTEDQKVELSHHLEYIERVDQKTAVDRTSQLRAELGGIKTRQARLIDAFVDGHLDKDSFEIRKRSLLEHERSLEDAVKGEQRDSAHTRQFLLETLELASRAQQSYEIATPASRRELVLRLTSNRTVAGKDVSIEPYFPLRLMAAGACVQCGPHHRYTSRTFAKIAWKLWRWGRRWNTRVSRVEC